MSDKLQLLFSRRSIRSYGEGAVPKEDILEMIKAGMAAPSAVNQRPWHVTVVTDPEMRTKIAGEQGAWRTCLAAPVVLIVSGDKRRFFTGEREAIQAFWQQDCAALTQNILLAATALGYGSLWMGVYPNPKAMQGLKERIAVPEHLEPFSLIAIGPKGEEKEARTQYEEEQVTWL